MNDVAMNIQNGSVLWCALINRNVSCVPAVPPLACPEPFCGYCYLTSPLSHLLNMTSTGPPWVDHSLATASTAFVGLSRYIRASIPLLPRSSLLSIFFTSSLDMNMLRLMSPSLSLECQPQTVHKQETEFI